MPNIQSVCTAFALLASLSAGAGELVVLVGTGTEMPMARIENGELVDGIHKDLGEALAAASRRSVRFLAMPRKRMSKTLEDGTADVLCAYVPEWMPGPFDWSTPFFPVIELLVSSTKVTRPASLLELAGKPVGTVLGYSHPEIDEVLGKAFVRDDAANAEINLRKLAAGRVQYALTGKSFLDHRLKLGDPPLSLHPPMVVKTYMAQCAVSRRARVTLAEVNAAVAKLQADGSIVKIIQHYQ
ncbi:MAG: transporter substrate-binding domain-containing protein [Pseudomonadota bacterium]